MQQLTVITGTGISDPVYSSVALPDSIKPGAHLTAHRFLSSSSRHVSTSGLEGKATNELLCPLLLALHTDLGIDCNPGQNPVREPQAKKGTKEDISHIILVGASNMRQTAAHIRDLGHKVTEFQLLGGMPNDSGIEAIAKFLTETASRPDTAIVFDLFGNFAYRFEQSDGNMALPIWLAGKPHMLGRVGVCSDKILKNLIEKLVPVLGIHNDTPKSFCRRSLGLWGGLLPGHHACGQRARGGACGENDRVYHIPEKTDLQPTEGDLSVKLLGSQCHRALVAVCGWWQRRRRGQSV